MGGKKGKKKLKQDCVKTKQSFACQWRKRQAKQQQKYTDRSITEI